MRRGRLRRDGSWAVPGVLLAAQTAMFLWVFLQYPVRQVPVLPAVVTATLGRAREPERILEWPPMVPRIPVQPPIDEPQDPYRVGPEDPPLESRPPSLDRSFFQDRFGGRRNAVARGGGTQGPGGTEAAVGAGLRWLARHQNDDGSWSGHEFNGCVSCKGKDPDAHVVETTALGLLALLGNGYTHLTRETYVDSVSGRTTCFGQTVKNAIRWLISHQDAGGGFSSASGSRNLRAEAVAALALGEAYGMTNNMLFKDAAQKSLGALTSARRRDGGWGTTPHAAAVDVVTTAWALCAIRVARASGLPTEEDAVARAHVWLDREVELAGKSPAGLFAHILTGAGWCAGAVVQALQAAKTEPVTSPGPLEPEVWHWTTLALFHATALGRPEWRGWNEGLTSVFVHAQAGNTEPCAAGSWTAPDDFPGGRLRATALNILTLESYYRYPRRLCEPALK